MKKLVLLELNEINIDLVQDYIEQGFDLPNFRILLSNGVKKTSSESEYKLIEPWIQWVSVHTGKSFSDHNVFRLGDIVKCEAPQIFEQVEQKGFSVGCISPMNTKNSLKNPSFFIPDPWTKTPTDGRWYSDFLWSALEQSVNDNASGKVTLSTYVKLLIASIYLVRPKRYLFLCKKFSELRGSRHGKAIFLDILLFEIFFSLNNKYKPDFATLFLNGGAHIQHHYLYSSSVLSKPPFVNPSWYLPKGVDPLAKILLEYDAMLGEIMSLNNVVVYVATGLSQIPFENPIYYYRLTDHASFLNAIGLKYRKVLPRMTRDFLIIFNDNSERDEALSKLSNILFNDEKVFDDIEVRDRELFVTLTYSNEVNRESRLRMGDEPLHIQFYDSVSFVALKNGHHSGRGYFMSSDKSVVATDSNVENVTDIYKLICKHFGVKRTQE